MKIWVWIAEAETQHRTDLEEMSWLDLALGCSIKEKGIEGASDKNGCPQAGPVPSAWRITDAPLGLCFCVSVNE